MISLWQQQSRTYTSTQAREEGVNIIPIDDVMARTCSTVTLFVYFEATDRQRKRRRSFEACDCPVVMRWTEPPSSDGDMSEAAPTTSITPKGWRWCGRADLHVAPRSATSAPEEEGGMHSHDSWTVSLTKLETEFCCTVALLLDPQSASCHERNVLPNRPSSLLIDEQILLNQSRFPPSVVSLRSCPTSTTNVPPASYSWHRLDVLQPSDDPTTATTTAAAGGVTRSSHEWPAFAVMADGAAKTAIKGDSTTSHTSLHQQQQQQQTSPRRKKITVGDVVTIGGDCCAAQSLRLSHLRTNASLPLDWVRSTPRSIVRILEDWIEVERGHHTLPNDEGDATGGYAGSTPPFAVFADGHTHPVRHTPNSNQYFLLSTTDEGSEGSSSSSSSTAAHRLWLDQHYGLIGTTEEVENAQRRWPRLRERLRSAHSRHSRACGEGADEEQEGAPLLLVHVAQSVGLSNGLYCQVDGSPLGSPSQAESWADLLRVLTLCNNNNDGNRRNDEANDDEGRPRTILLVVNLFVESFTIALIHHRGGDVEHHDDDHESTSVSYVIHLHVGCDAEWERTAARVAEAMDARFTLTSSSSDC